jgi:protein-L-isoaspartate O-methyltransferase
MAAPAHIPLERFVGASRFTRPVDRKKLAFVYAAIQDHARVSGRSVSELRALELGCADGPVTLPLATLGCTVTAVDLDEPALEELRRSLVQRQLTNVTVKHGDAQAYDDGRRYDVVVAADVISNVPSPPLLLDVMAARAETGAVLVLTTPNPYGPYALQRKYVNPISRLKRARSIRRLAGKPPAPPRQHPRDQFYDRRQLLTAARLEELFRERGLSIAKRANSDGVLAALGPLYARSSALGRADTALAERLPSWLASGWYYRLHKDSP